MNTSATGSDRPCVPPAGARRGAGCRWRCCWSPFAAGGPGRPRHRRGRRRRPRRGGGGRPVRGIGPGWAASAGGVVPPGLAWQPDGPCQGFIVVADIGEEHPRCSTGPEVFPEVKAGTKLAEVPSNPLPCEGNGTDGFRIQVAYVHQGASDRATATDLANIRAVTLQANDALVASARTGGARRNFRFVTKGCQLDIIDAQVAASDSDRVYDVLRQSARFTRLDRVYLVYVSPAVLPPTRGRGRDLLLPRRHPRGLAQHQHLRRQHGPHLHLVAGHGRPRRAVGHAGVGRERQGDVRRRPGGHHQRATAGTRGNARGRSRRRHRWHRMC